MEVGERFLVNMLIPPSGVQRGNFTPIESKESSFRLLLSKIGASTCESPRDKCS